MKEKKNKELVEEHLFNNKVIKNSGKKLKPNPKRIKEPNDLVPLSTEKIIKNSTKREMERYIPSTEELGNIVKYGLAKAMLERFLNVEGGPENLEGEEFDRFLKTAAQMHKMYQTDIQFFLRTAFDDLDETEAKEMLEKFAHRQN